jgi:vitamin B12 transporter
MKTVSYIFCFGALFLSQFVVLGENHKDTVDLTILVLKGKNAELGPTNANPLYLGSTADRLRLQEGIYIKEGSGKMLSSVRINGATPAQTGISWNGLKLNNAFNGQIDLNLLPSNVMNFGMVNLGSAQFGANSMTGTLLIEQAKFDSQLIVDLNYGSFGVKNVNLYKKFNFNKSSHYLSGAAHQSVNNYKYIDYSVTQQEKRLPNAYAEIYNILYGNQFEIDQVLKLQSNFWYTNATRQLPPNTVGAVDSSYQKDESWRGQVELIYQKNKWILSQNNAVSIDNLRFVSPFASINSLYKSVQNSNDLKANYKINTTLQFFGIIRFENQQTQYFLGQHRSLQNYHTSGRVVYEKQKWLITAGLSRDKYSIGYEPINYQTSIQKKIKKWVLGYSFGSSFRPPTFNDLYWPTGGNEQLLPEEGITHRGQLGYILPIKNNHFIRFNLSAQAMHLQNQIVWLPNGSNAFWSPINIAETYHLSSNLKVYTDFVVRKSQHVISLNANYVEANAMGYFANNPQLIYTPKWTLNGNYVLGFGKNQWIINSQYQSKTFINTENTKALAGFNCVNTKYLRRIPSLKSTVYVGINNLSNRSYEVTEKRPMPGINYIIGLTIKL